MTKEIVIICTKTVPSEADRAVVAGLSGASGMWYEACYLESTGGNSVGLVTHYGVHDFSRVDGRWLSGPCLNYVNYIITEESLKAPRQGNGYMWAIGGSGVQAALAAYDDKTSSKA